MTFSPDGRFAIVTDTGSDTIFSYPVAGGEVGEPVATPVRAGTAPRHFRFHQNGRWAFVINELSPTVTAFDFDPGTGALTERESVNLLHEVTEPGAGNAAELRIHPNGRLLFGTIRDNNSITSLTIDARSGALSLADCRSTGGEFPRSFDITPDGGYIVGGNEHSDTLFMFSVDVKDGTLAEVATPLPSVFRPSCFKFVQFHR